MASFSFQLNLAVAIVMAADVMDGSCVPGTPWNSLVGKYTAAGERAKHFNGTPRACIITLGASRNSTWRKRCCVVEATRRRSASSRPSSWRRAQRARTGRSSSGRGATASLTTRRAWRAPGRRAARRFSGSSRSARVTAARRSAATACSCSTARTIKPTRSGGSTWPMEKKSGTTATLRRDGQITTAAARRRPPTETWCSESAPSARSPPSSSATGAWSGKRTCSRTGTPACRSGRSRPRRSCTATM